MNHGIIGYACHIQQSLASAAAFCLYLFFIFSRAIYAAKMGVSVTYMSSGHVSIFHYYIYVLITVLRILRSSSFFFFFFFVSGNNNNKKKHYRASTRWPRTSTVRKGGERGGTKKILERRVGGGAACLLAQMMIGFRPSVHTSVVLMVAVVCRWATDRSGVE